MVKRGINSHLPAITLIGALILIFLALGLFDKAEYTGEVISENQIEVTTGIKSGEGYVTIKPIEIFCNDICSSNFNFGNRIYLVATPNDGYHFSHWTGDSRECNSKSSTLSISVSRSISCFAVFEKN